MPTVERPIGVFDSGIGGLTVLKHLTRLMPDERFVYLGDTARVPYGNRSAETVKMYALECAAFLSRHDVKMIVVACNTVSAIALPTLAAVFNSSDHNIPVVGVIEPAARVAVQTTTSGRIGVIGTRATIASDAYAISLRKYAGTKELSIHSRACPLFVPLVEEGWLDTPATRLIAEEYLRPLMAQQIDTLVLGCTHYPVLSPMLADLLPGVALIDCGACTASVAAQMLGVTATNATHQPRLDLYVTDHTPAFGTLARQFLGTPVNDPVLATLDASAVRVS